MQIVLASFGDAHPSGENLEYERVFTDMTLAAQPGEDRQVGDDVVAGGEPDPKAVAQAASAVLSQSHDLRAAVLMAYAELRMNGYPGFAEVTTYIRGCLEDFWDSCHPQLDADDDDDPTMRVNAVLGLVDATLTLRALRRAPLTDSSNFGRISVRDLMIVSGELDAAEGADAPPAETQIAAAFRDTPADRFEAILAAARRAQEDLIAINAIFDEKIPGRGPSLDPVLAILKRAVARLAEAAGEDADDTTEAGDAPADAATSGGAPSGRAGEIGSSRDVERVLDQIIRYYERTEPSSPVPLLLQRAKRLIGADFMSIVNDLAPAGADNVRLVGGVEASD